MANPEIPCPSFPSCTALVVAWLFPHSPLALRRAFGPHAGVFGHRAALRPRAATVWAGHRRVPAYTGVSRILQIASKPVMIYSCTSKQMTITSGQPWTRHCALLTNALECAQGKLADMYATTQVQLRGHLPRPPASVTGLAFAFHDSNVFLLLYKISKATVPRSIKLLCRHAAHSSTGQQQQPMPAGLTERTAPPSYYTRPRPPRA